MSKRKNEVLCLLRTVADEFGLDLDTKDYKGRNHSKFYLVNRTTGQRRFVPMPCSASDWRALKNQKCMARNIARGIA